MKDDRVTFIKGDAFTFDPTTVMTPPNNSSNDVWMISDIICLPERCTELLEHWCSNHWASSMIVTMKFQGDKPALDELDHAIDIVQSHGYQCRAKHFFNNKNEVTLMISSSSEEEEAGGMTTSPAVDLEPGLLGSAFYPVVLPKNH
jgi:23S rRNA C2498 (ribose-2'-O)-methylase RlmM